MSAQFILYYAGSAVKIENGIVQLVRDDCAGVYQSEPDAWYAAHEANLNPDRCRVENLSQSENKPSPVPVQP